LNNNNLTGRFAIIENLAYDNAIILVFETPYFVTGENVAVLGCFGINDIKDIQPGDIIESHFEARSALTFDEECSARQKGSMSVRIGTYHGNGILANDSKCVFEFSSDIFEGKWLLSKLKVSNDSMRKYKTYFPQGCLVLKRIE
jgi:hypothetical protein